MIGNVGAIAIGPSGAALIPLISDGKWLGYILGLLAAYAGGFVATFFFGIPKDRLEKEELATETATVNEVPEKVVPQTSAESVTILSSVADGTVVSLDKASDPVFAQKMMGEGYFVEPENGHIYSPVTGVVSSVFPTKHAIGITTPNGLEILLHMGINTVDLGGTPFDVKVTEGQQVTPDTLVAEADLEAIKAAGKETSMIVLVTNMDRVKNFVLEKTGKAKAKAPVMDVKA
ncbi:TPA: glucose PTS transporter subunit IIA [Enterococcus faecium]